MINNYTITTWDDAVYTLDNVNAEKLIDAWTEADKPFPVDIGGAAFSSSSIKSITPNHVTEADLPKANDKLKQLQAGKRCRGQYSIQAEINKAAKELGGKDWAKLIQNKAWREKIRNQLRTTPADWCDYKAGECACESDFLSYKARHDRALA